MKLRNKKTGEVGELHYEPDKKYHFTVATDDPADMTIHKTLTELNEEWEDYKPAEPLIKDEKVRNAVRAWAEANGDFEDIEIHALTAGTRFSIGHYDIEFMGYFIYDLESNKTYTLAELCGEEEE